MGMIMTLAKKSIRNFAPSSLKREKYRRRSHLQYFQRGAYLDEQNTPKNNDLIRHMAVYSKKKFLHLCVCLISQSICRPCPPRITPTHNIHVTPTRQSANIQFHIKPTLSHNHQPTTSHSQTGGKHD